MRKIIVLLAMLLLGGTQAHAQATTELCVRATPTGFCQAVDATRPLPVTNAGSGGTLDVNIAEVNGATPSTGAGATDSGTLRVVQSNDSPAVPVAGSVTVAGCTVGVASAGCIAALALTRWVQLQNTHATNSIACQWGAGPAALNSNNSFMLAPGQSASWGPSTGGVPTNALQCIASGAGTPLYVEYR